MRKRRISILDSMFPIFNTLDHCITQENDDDYRNFSLLDRDEFYRKSSELLCEDVLQWSISEKKMCTVVQKMKKLLKEKRVATKAKPIKQLESKIVAMGFTLDVTRHAQSLL